MVLYKVCSKYLAVCTGQGGPVAAPAKLVDKQDRLFRLKRSEPDGY